MAKVKKLPMLTVRTLAGVDVPVADLSHITIDLRTLAVPIDSLKPDPRNARLHGEKNRSAIRASLQKFGQQETISIDANGVILAGNGRWNEAKSLGWKYVAVSRTALTGAAARAWALSANRTGELAEWDTAELQASLEELKTAEFDLEGLEIGEKELEALAEGDFETAHGFAPKKPDPEPEGGDQPYAPVFKIIVNCKNEREQRKLIEEFDKRGLDFTAPNVT